MLGYYSEIIAVFVNLARKGFNINSITKLKDNIETDYLIPIKFFKVR